MTVLPRPDRPHVDFAWIARIVLFGRTCYLPWPSTANDRPPKGKDAMKSHFNVHSSNFVVGVFLLLSGTVGARATATEPPDPSQLQDSSVPAAITIKQIQPYRFSRVNPDTEGIRIISKPFIAPEAPSSTAEIDASWSAKLSPTMSEEWKILTFNCFQLEADGKVTRPLDCFYVVPSECNGFCENTTQYAVRKLKGGQRYFVEYVLLPRKANANPSATIKTLGSSAQDALAVKVWYEFPEPYSSTVRRSSVANPVDAAGLAR